MGLISYTIRIRCLEEINAGESFGRQGIKMRQYSGTLWAKREEAHQADAYSLEFHLISRTILPIGLAGLEHLVLA